jgi:hypothetical protein
MVSQEGWKFLDDSAMRIVLEKSPAVASAIAEWFLAAASAASSRYERPDPPPGAWNLVGEILEKGNSYGFVVVNYEQLSRKVLFLLEFEKLRKAKNPSRRQKLRK